MRKFHAHEKRSEFNYLQFIIRLALRTWRQALDSLPWQGR